MLNDDMKNRLLATAKEARKHAYAPYSGDFSVGAAILTEDGRIFSGCNVENASFGATVCAERVAILKAVSDGYRKIVAVAVVADLADPIAPCGMCLQVLSEFGREAEVIMANTAGRTRLSRVSELLPYNFRFKATKE